jgi:hypothetical protein
MNAITQAETLELAPQQERPARALAVADNSHTGIMLSLMDRGASLEQIEKMMDLVERNEKREAEKAYNESLAAFKSLNIKIVKRKVVDFTTQRGRTTYKHAELDDVVQAVGPGLSEHGFAWSWKTKQEAGSITVACVLRHKLGHSEHVSLSADADASGGKNGIQAIISTTTYLQRHTLKQICGVAESGEDDDGAGEPGAPEIPPDLLAAAREAAMGGWKSLAAWTKSITQEQRALLTLESDALKAAAKAVDQKGTAQ